MVEGAMMMRRVPLKDRLAQAYRKYKRPFGYAFAVMLTFFIIWLALISLLGKCV